MHHPTRLLAYGFIVILIMMVFLAFIAFHANEGSSLLFSQTVTNQLEKIRLVSEISRNIDSRARFIQSMLLRKGSLDSEMVWADLNRFSANYIDSHQRLTEILSATEKESILSLDLPIDSLNSSIGQALKLLLSGNREQVDKILLDEVFPKTTLILDQYSNLNQSLAREINLRLNRATGDAENKQNQFVIFAIFTLLTSLGIAVFAIWYNQKLSSQLEDINTHLEEKVSERTETLLDTQRELMEDNSELARLASTDAVTGLSNRSYMTKILEKEYSRYMRHNHLFGIIMLDIDHFKKVNDDYGHDIGDTVLIQLARQLEQAVRNSDYISRWGGEEFLICCTTIQPDSLLPIAETIRLKIASNEYDVPEGITASLGCAIIQPEEEIKELIKRADVALYAAKNNGRNRTIVSEFSEFI